MKVLNLILHATIIISIVSCAQTNNDQSVIEVDVCVYGGTSSGVIAAYTAQMLGKSTVLIEPGTRLGGLSSGGLGYTDIGNKYAITGLARDFYRRIGKHYGKFEQWIFEPGVAEKIFQEYTREGKVRVLYENRLHSVSKNGTQIGEIILKNSGSSKGKQTNIIRAKMFIDCSYEGDLMAKADVSYIVGREDNSLYNETINGVQLMEGHQFPDGIDPYKVKGDPSSGLLWGISNETLPPLGSGDKKVQAYNYRICLTNNPENRIPVTRPEDYDSVRYELLLRLFDAYPEKRKLNDYFIWSAMPNQKTDINNRGGFSTDMIGMNYDYPEGDYETRKRITHDHEVYTKGLLYFYGHDLRVPEELRAEMQQWGYPKDEYEENDHWSPQLYVREARRMIGEYVMTQANCEGKETVTDGIGLAAYTMDSHNCQRLVFEGVVKNEGNVEVGGFGPYPIAYRSIIPKASECTNLFVPVCLSASHIAYGSIRMEPVFMVLGQSAAMAANLAIEKSTSVQQVNIGLLQHQLIENPLVSGAQREILVDDNSTENVVTAGNWIAKTTGGYGPTWLIHSGAESPAFVRYTPDIKNEGNYAAYLYFPKAEGMASNTTIMVFDGNTETERTIKSEDIIVEGQTSGEWASLGTYAVPEGRKFYVEVNTQNTDGRVVADALILVPEQADQ